MRGEHIEAYKARLMQAITRARIMAAVIGLLAVLVLIFAVQNADTVRMEFLFWDVDWSLTILVFTMLVVGIVAGWLLRSFRDPEGFDLFGDRGEERMRPPPPTI